MKLTKLQFKAGNAFAAFALTLLLAFGLTPALAFAEGEAEAADQATEQVAPQEASDSLETQTSGTATDLGNVNCKITLKYAGKDCTGSALDYTGSALEPTVTVTNFGKTLTKGTDYTVSYTHNTDPGTATVTVAGKNSYSGTKTATFKIVGSLSTLSLGTTQYLYNGSAHEPSVTVKGAGKTLTKGTDYTVSYSNNVNSGTATATVTGKGNYKGTLTGKFHITGVSYRSFVSSWKSYVGLGSISGAESGTSKVLGISAKVTSNYSGGISYSVYRTSWSSFVSNNATAGAAKKGSSPVQAIKMKLTGTLADKYDIYYRVYISGGNWMGWTKNGNPAGLINVRKSMKVVGYQVQLVKKGAAAPGSTKMPYATSAQSSFDSYAKYLLRSRIEDRGSNTDYIMSVDTTLNRVCVYKGSKGNWTLQRYFKCGSGIASYPSAKGDFTLKSRRYRIDSGESSYWYFHTYSGALGFHSNLTRIGSINTPKPSLSKQLGKNVSHGCIRLALTNAKYVYGLPNGSHVTIRGLV